MRNFIVFLMALFCLFIFIAQGECSIKKSSIMVNGRTIADKAIINRGVAYVPLHKVMSIIKCKYKWIPSSRSLIVNGKPVSGKLIRYAGVLYISYISVARCSGLPVAYDSIGNKVYINPNMTPDALAASLGGRRPVKAQPAVKKIQQRPRVETAASIKEPFIPVSTENDIFKVSVTNLEESASVKGQRPSSPSNKFITVYLSQQNISNEVQIYTGKFALLDREDRVYEYSEGLSNFWLVVLRPSGANFGYIVFEVPRNARAKKLVLSTTSRPPLVINFR